MCGVRGRAVRCCCNLTLTMKNRLTIKRPKRYITVVYVHVLGIYIVSSYTLVRVA